MFSLPRKQSAKCVSLFLFLFIYFFPRYSIDKRSDPTKAFKIDPNNGTITVAEALDRETSSLHNLTVEAKETSKEISKLFTKASCRYGNLLAYLSSLSHETCPEYIHGDVLMTNLCVEQWIPTRQLPESTWKDCAVNLLITKKKDSK